MTVFSENEHGAPSVAPLKPLSLLSNGLRFQPHAFADQWLGQWGLVGDAPVTVTYQEVETQESAAISQRTSVPLRDAVTQGFLIAHQSRVYPNAHSPREGWVYPHRSLMTVDFSSLRVNGKALSPDVLQQLQTGIVPGYQGTGQPVVTEVDAQGNLLSARGKEQARQLALLDSNQVNLARLFAGLPTFDSVLKNLLVSRIKAKLAEKKLRPSLRCNIDPDHWYVSHFTLDANGGRSLTASQSFIDVMRGCLVTDTPPTYSVGDVGFFARPDSVEEADSLFTDPVDKKVLGIMESVFYIAQPTIDDSVRRQFRDDLVAFGRRENLDDSSTAETALAHLLLRRFAHLFDLYKADRNPDLPLSQSERTQRDEEDRVLDLITTHPSMADRNRLLRAPIPHVYAVMLDMGAAISKKWPAAMVIKRSDRPSLFLYSLERGIQRFRSFQDLVNSVRPVSEGQARMIRDIASELSEPVFEVAAQDLLQLQQDALETFLSAAENETAALSAFALNVEHALELPMLSLAGPLAVRLETLIENERPGFYQSAAPSEKANYLKLEKSVLEAAYALGGSNIQTLMQFTREKIKRYLQQSVHPGIDPDPDKTMVTLSFGKRANPRQSRISSLTQLMLDNLRPEQYPNAMREVLSAYVVDQDGHRIRHPGSGYFVTLTGRELARMATSIDAGGSYETMLREAMNKTNYKKAWQAAYLANLKFKAYEAGLRGNEVFKASVVDKAFTPAKPQKLLALWLDAVVRSPAAQTRSRVMGRRVHVHGLLLGGSVAAGGQNTRMANATSIDGALIFSDQEGPDIQGTVGVYFPDSPEGDDLHEFADLSDGVAGLLQREEWQGYFASRISTRKPEEIKRTLGQQRGRPLIRGSLISGDLLEVLHRAHVNFQSAYADQRSNSNRDVAVQTRARLGQVAAEVVIDLALMFLAPGFRLLIGAMKTGLLIFRTGSIPLNFKTLAFIHTVANHGGWRLTHTVVTPSRGPSFFRAVTARQTQDEALTGLPLETEIYRSYVVSDTSVIQGLTADARGFYRATVSDVASGRVMARPIYVRQPDGTLFRVHDSTRLNATEAVLVDPVTGLNIVSSGVMRRTVARMSNGEWRAVGFGRGGGKRPADTPAQPGPSKKPALSVSAVSNSIRTPGTWNNRIMDLVPSIMTRLAIWPQNRSLLIIDEISAERAWSVRFTPGQHETIYPVAEHPDRADTDVVLRRTSHDHYSLVLGERVVEINADGDCLFNGLAAGLNEGRSQQTFTMQGLRDAAADHIDQHPELSQYVAPQVSDIQQALFENAPSLVNLLDNAAVLDLTRIIYGTPNPHRLFQPTLDYLDLHVTRSIRTAITEAPGTRLPPEILQEVGRLVSPRSPANLTANTSAPFSAQEKVTMQRLFEDILLGPVDDQNILRLLDNKYLLISKDVAHIMLEYGLTARQLLGHHPRNSLGYVRYDEQLHGHLDADAIEELLDGAHLVDRNDLDDVKDLLMRDRGRFVDDDAELFEEFMYADRVERTVDLLRTALGRFPVLRRRVDILLRSPVIIHNLGGMLPVSEVARLIRNPALSDRRFELIAAYANSRHGELERTGRIDLDWMQVFDDRNLQSVVSYQDNLTAFMRFLGGARENIESIDVPAVAKLFSPPGHLPSNTRVAILFNTPGLLGSLMRLQPNYAMQIWLDLIGPYFSDATIRQALGRPGSLRTGLDFAIALRDSLGNEEAHANRIVQNLLSISQRRAQQYLYSFDFPTNRLGHSRLDFAVYLESHQQIPGWAWQYARRGVTPDSLEQFGEMKPKPD